MALTITYKRTYGRTKKQGTHHTLPTTSGKRVMPRLLGKDIIALKNIRRAGEKAALRARKTMGYTITQSGNWIVKTDTKGNIVQRIVQIERAGTPKVILLD